MNAYPDRWSIEHDNGYTSDYLGAAGWYVRHYGCFVDGPYRTAKDAERAMHNVRKHSDEWDRRLLARLRG